MNNDYLICLNFFFCTFIVWLTGSQYLFGFAIRKIVWNMATSWCIPSAIYIGNPLVYLDQWIIHSMYDICIRLNIWSGIQPISVNMSIPREMHATGSLYHVFVCVSFWIHLWKQWKAILKLIKHNHKPNVTKKIL